MPVKNPMREFLVAKTNVNVKKRVAGHLATLPSIIPSANFSGYFENSG